MTRCAIATSAGMAALHLLGKTTSHSTRLLKATAKSLVIPQSAGYAGNVSEVRPRRGGAEPSGAGVAALHLLGKTTSHSTRLLKAAAKSLVIPQTAGYASNVSEVQP
jgi:hypothetical protein